MDGGLRRTETGTLSFAVPQAGAVGERSAKHRFPCGAAGIAKGGAAAPLRPFTGDGTSYSTRRKVNGTLHLTDKYQVFSIVTERTVRLGYQNSTE